jgi:hypothetical protein
MQRFLSLVVGLALVAAACGSDDSSSDAGSSSETTVQTTTTTTAPTTTTTTAPTTTTAAEAGGIVPGQDAEVDAIVLAFTTALDSETPYDDKAGFIEDPTGLEDTVAKYLETGQSMGGIGVEVTGVEITGGTAAVTYDLLFGGNPTYPDLTGEAIKTDGAWKITRTGFCSLMSSARVGCP